MLLIRLAPTFSTLSARSIDLATVTPSFVIKALPNSCSIKTVLPEGPRVEATAEATASMPDINLSLIGVSNKISFAIQFLNYYLMLRLLLTV